MTNSEDKVVVRRRWNAPDTSEIAAGSLWGLHVRNEPGGVCRALPRDFLFAHVWCDKVTSGLFGHSCSDGPPPHDLLVCILPADNLPALYERLRLKARG